MSLKKIVKENIFTKKRRCLDLNERTKEHSFINPTVGVYSKNNMITFNNLTFVNEEGIKFTGNFSLIYKITDYVKFSYHKNYAEVLKSIVEAYLQNLFNNINYYDKFVFSPIKIKDELNMLVNKYIEGINVIDVSDLNIENHFNLTFEEDTIVEPDSFIEEENIDNQLLNKYSDTGRFILSTEDIYNYSRTSRTNIHNVITNEYYVASDEFGIFESNSIIKPGYHFISVPGRKRINCNDNVYMTGKMVINKNSLKNGISDYLIEGKIIYRINDPKKFVNATKDYLLYDYLSKSFYNFLLNFDRVYGIKNLRPVYSQNDTITLFKYNNDEYILKLEEYGIDVNAICIISKERRENSISYVRK